MIQVEVLVPAINEQYDFKVDDNAYIADVIEEIGEIILSARNGNAPGNVDDLILCDNERRYILPLDRSLKQCGIGNGSSLMIV